RISTKSEPPASAHARGRASKEHGPGASFDHIRRGFAGADERAKSRHAPRMLELFRRCINHSVATRGTRVLNHSTNYAEFPPSFFNGGRDIRRLTDIRRHR